MAKKGSNKVRVGKRKPKLKNVLLKDPKDSFLHSKRVKHNKMMRVNPISSKSTKKSKKPKKRVKHKSQSKDVKDVRSGKISKKAYEDYYKNWFKDPKRIVKRKMSKR